jgi:hypothetical protein
MAKIIGFPDRKREVTLEKGVGGTYVKLEVGFVWHGPLAKDFDLEQEGPVEMPEDQISFVSNALFAYADQLENSPKWEEDTLYIADLGSR